VHDILLEVDLFGDPATRALSEQALAHALEALTIANQVYLRRNPNAPHPLAAGIRFEREPVGVEKWQSYGRLLQTKRGDCEDISAAVAAWKREREGRPARAQIIARRQAGPMLVYHIGVNTLGRIEDPSRAIGMGSIV